jgi:hypothetical protein
MGPVTAGGSTSGELKMDEELLCRLSNEDFALSMGGDMIDGLGMPNVSL